MKVLVTGGRKYADHMKVHWRLSELPPDATVIQGGARGADRLALDAALELGLHVITVEAEWDRYRPADPKKKNPAGAIRNRAMLDMEPDLVWAFPGGAGTAGCVREAKRRGIPVEEIE